MSLPVPFNTLYNSHITFESGSDFAGGPSGVTIKVTLRAYSAMLGHVENGENDKADFQRTPQYDVHASQFVGPGAVMNVRNKAALWGHFAGVLEDVWAEAHRTSLRAQMNDNHVEGLRRMLGCE